MPRYIFCLQAENKVKEEGIFMKQEEKKPITWEVADPKPPVIQSGRMENRRQN